MIDLRPYDDRAAFEVFLRLDVHDFIEAETVRGGAATSAGLFADWRAAQSPRLLSIVAWAPRAYGQDVPFAVFGLSHTGQAGVAEAAMLARDHARYRRELVELARLIGARIPAFCREAGIHRIEARSLVGHPRAAGFLSACGFRFEARLPGFGPKGLSAFNQFAFIPIE